eukprot:27674_2
MISARTEKQVVQIIVTQRTLWSWVDRKPDLTGSWPNISYCRCPTRNPMAVRRQTDAENVRIMLHNTSLESGDAAKMIKIRKNGKTMALTRMKMSVLLNRPSPTLENPKHDDDFELIDNLAVSYSEEYDW